MSIRPLFPQLHALIGDAANLLPALLARMDGRDAADGQRLEVQGANPAQAATMAGLSRTLAGLNTLIQLLHAAEIAREQGGAHQQLTPDVVDGLLLGARELACYARLQLE